MKAADAEVPVERVIGGKYRLARLVGEGGMGQVFEAEHLVTRRRVAVKVLTEGVRWSQEAIERFLREAQIPAAIGHPNIVEVLDAGTSEDGSPYLVMEFLTGESVADVLTEKVTLSPREAVWIAVEVLDALAAAHLHGVVHRDVKPENVFLTTSRGKRRVKLLDFGISKLTPGGRAAGDRALTVVGQVIGTADYMSPEQVRGDASLDARTDLWSVGVMLYEMLSGERPFDGPNYNLLVYSVLTKEIRALRDVAPGVPAALDEIVGRALQRDLAHRWSSAAEMQAALQRYLGESPRSVHPCRPSARPSFHPVGASDSPSPIIPRPPRVAVVSDALHDAPTDDGPPPASDLPPPLVPRRSPLHLAALAAALLALPLGGWLALRRDAPQSAPAPRAAPPVTPLALEAPAPPPTVAAPDVPAAPAPPETAPAPGMSPAPSEPHAPRRRARHHAEAPAPAPAPDPVPDSAPAPAPAPVAAPAAPDPEPAETRPRAAPVRSFDEL